MDHQVKKPDIFKNVLGLFFPEKSELFNFLFSSNLYFHNKNHEVVNFSPIDEKLFEFMTTQIGVKNILCFDVII